MSAESLRRIFATFEPRIAAVGETGDGMALLTEFHTALARDLAEAVFLSAQTQPGLTQNGAQHLADETLMRNGLDIVETVHAFGGTFEMVESLTEAAARAYSARLAELSAGYGQGGAA